MEMAPYCAEKEEAGNTSSDAGLKRADKVSGAGEPGHQGD